MIGNECPWGNHFHNSSYLSCNCHGKGVIVDVKVVAKVKDDHKVYAVLMGLLPIVELMHCVHQFSQ